MKLIILTIPIILIFICSSVKAADKFHSAITDQEKTLDEILIYNRDVGMIDIDESWIDNSYEQKAKKYKAVTIDLIKSIASWEKEEVKKNCDGRYIEGELCGYGINSVSCSQDPPDNYLYKTKKISTTEVVISPQWPSDVSYKFRKEGNIWMLDGIDCGWQKFNM